MRHIVVTGNPKDGFRFIGPWAGSWEAAEWAERLAPDWWVVELEHPKDVEGESDDH